MAQSKNVVTLTSQNFEAEVLKATVPVLVDFTATWCGPCQRLAPIVEQVADEFAGRVKVGKLDIDDNRDLATRYGIRSVPTVFVFENGQKKAQHLGLTNRATLVQLLGV